MHVDFRHEYITKTSLRKDETTMLIMGLFGHKEAKRMLAYEDARTYGYVPDRTRLLCLTRQMTYVELLEIRNSDGSSAGHFIQYF